MNPYLLQIARLETELEAMRQRAEAAEAALYGSEDKNLWRRPVAPLSLYRTRLARLLAIRDMTGAKLLAAMQGWYPTTSHNTLKAQLSYMRRDLPAHIAPPREAPCGWGETALYTIPDREALRAFLDGQMPMARIAA